MIWIIISISYTLSRFSCYDLCYGLYCECRIIYFYAHLMTVCFFYLVSDTSPLPLYSPPPHAVLLYLLLGFCWLLWFIFDYRYVWFLYCLVVAIVIFFCCFFFFLLLAPFYSYFLHTHLLFVPATRFASYGFSYVCFFLLLPPLGVQASL